MADKLPAPHSHRGRFAIVAAKFNAEIVERLVAGALAALRTHNLADDDVDVVRVPGAFELPLVCQALAATGDFAAVIALGAVLRGETDHYDYVCRGVTDGLMRATLATNVPILFGVLTCASEELALARAGGAAGNKGYDVAVAAIEMANLMESLTGRRT